jgi:hypothetical protein
MKQLTRIIDYAFFYFFAVTFWLCVIAHLTLKPSLFFTFQSLHNSFVRNYYALLEGQSAEYGIWPGMLKAMGTDFAAIFIALTAVVIPLAVFKHYINREHSIKDAVTKHLAVSLTSLAVTFIAGSIVMSLLAAILMSIGLFLLGAPVSDSFETVIEIAASGVILTDLLLCVVLWSIELDRGGGNSPLRSILSRRRVIIPLTAAVMISAAASYLITTEVEIEIPDRGAPVSVYAYDMFNDRVPLDEEIFPDSYLFSASYSGQTIFTDDALYTTLGRSVTGSTYKNIFIYAGDLPHFGYFRGFFNGRPEGVQFIPDKMKTRVTYKAHDYNKNRAYIYWYTQKPRYRNLNFNMKVHGSAPWVSTEIILTRQADELYSASLSADSTAGNYASGFMAVEQKTGKEYFFTASGKTVNLGIRGKDGGIIILWSGSIDSPAQTMMIKDEEGGLALFINNRPVLYSAVEFSKLYAAVSADNEVSKNPITLSCTIGTAKSIIKTGR